MVICFSRVSVQRLLTAVNGQSKRVRMSTVGHTYEQIALLEGLFTG